MTQRYSSLFLLNLQEFSFENHNSIDLRDFKQIRAMTNRCTHSSRLLSILHSGKKDNQAALKMSLQKKPSKRPNYREHVSIAWCLINIQMKSERNRKADYAIRAWTKFRKEEWQGRVCYDMFSSFVASFSFVFQSNLNDTLIDSFDGIGLFVCVWHHHVDHEVSKRCNKLFISWTERLLTFFGSIFENDLMSQGIAWLSLWKFRTR